MRESLRVSWGFRLSLIFSFTLLWGATHAQSRTVTGVVRDGKSNETLPGVNVVLKGTATGTITDGNGAYSLNVTSDSDVLIFSFIGYSKAEVQVGTNTTLDVNMELDVVSLEEVVVVGYGEQKKSVVTGAISRVSADNLEKVPNGSIGTALQGRVAGVTIAQESGQPGSAATIRIRGVTTFGGGNNPLWVIDGVVVDQATMGYLNQSDIESVEVLKDATSAAIYGTRAATGVIIVTTKKGKAGKFSIDYNGFLGTSAPARKLDLLNAQQYATIINERSIGGGGPIVYSNPAALGQGTDWQKVIFNTGAFRSNHQISLSGGGEKSTYYFSAGYQKQEGIVLPEISGYEKYNVRINSTHKISKVFTLGQTLGYTHQNSKGIGNTNNEFGGPLSSAINLDPITPLYETDPAKLALYNPLSVKDDNGNVYGISTAGMQEMTNPAAYARTRLGNGNWSNDLIGNLSLEAAITPDLKIKSIASGVLSFWGDDGFSPSYYLGSGGGNSQPINRLWRNVNDRTSWNIENFITYNKTIAEDHNLTVMLGQGVYVQNVGGGNSFTLFNLPVNNYKDASFGFYSNSSTYTASAYTTDGNLYNNVHKLSSLFGRLNYSYKEKYLFTGILRRDGSNRFGKNNHYGLFPGASVGWNVSKEDFWPQNDIVNYLKIRAGFGTTGNDAIGDYGYLSLVNPGYNYTIGGNVQQGYTAKSLDNPDLKWETTTQTNIGFEAVAFKDLSITFDYFMKKTSGILRPVSIPGYVGVTDLPLGNVADMQNSGLELELRYKHRLGPVDFSATASGATLKNEVTYVASDVNFVTGDAGFQGMGTVTRIQVGQPYNAFFGYKTAGIFQTQEEVNSYVNSNGQLLQPNAKPGDFRWVDLNGDGKITSDDLDRTFLGSSIPKYTFGITLNFAYKNFDLMVFANGAGGNKIFQGLRRLDIDRANFSTAVLNRWTGPGSSNDYPRLDYSDPNRNFSNMSGFYLEDGDYLRFKIVQLGYTIPQNKVLSKLGLSRFRAYITAENLFTFTKYTGYDPEIGGNVFSIDKGRYPQARSFLFGIQVKF